MATWDIILTVYVLLTTIFTSVTLFVVVRDLRSGKYKELRKRDIDTDDTT